MSSSYGRGIQNKLEISEKLFQESLELDDFNRNL